MISEETLIINNKQIALQNAILELGNKVPDILNNVDLSSILNPKNTIYLSASEIAKELGKGWTGTKVNEILIEMKFQGKIRDDYYPTIEGVKSGCCHRTIMLKYDNSKTYFKYSISWTIEVVQHIKKFVEEKEETANGKE